MEQKINYNYLKGVKVDGGKVIAHVEGWTYARSGKALLNSFTYGEGKEGQSIKINGVYNKKELEYYFGDKVSNCISNKGYVIIDVVGFEGLKGLKAYNPTLQQVLGFTGTLALEEKEYNGKTIYTLKMNAVGFKPITAKKEEAGRVGATYGGATNPPADDLGSEVEDGDMPF